MEVDAILQSLETLLAYHGKLVMENRNKLRMSLVRILIDIRLRELEAFEGTIAKLLGRKDGTR